MHSTLVRAQNVFGFFTTVLFVVSGLIAGSVIFFPQHPSAEITLRNVQVVRGRPHYYSSKKEEYAHIRFDLDADFSSLFNWNTKQVFVYVLARWPTSSSSSSSSSASATSSKHDTFGEAIIWDKIIPSPSLLKTNLVTATLAKPKPNPSHRSSTSTSSDKEKGKQNETEKPGVIHVEKARAKYQITDLSGKLANKSNVTLEVRFNVQPWVGLLTWSRHTGRARGLWKVMDGGLTEPFTLPGIKLKNQQSADA